MVFLTDISKTIRLTPPSTTTTASWTATSKLTTATTTTITVTITTPTNKNNKIDIINSNKNSNNNNNKTSTTTTSVAFLTKQQLIWLALQHINTCYKLLSFSYFDFIFIFYSCNIGFLSTHICHVELSLLTERIEIIVAKNNAKKKKYETQMHKH